MTTNSSGPKWETRLAADGHRYVVDPTHKGHFLRAIGCVCCEPARKLAAAEDRVSVARQKWDLTAQEVRNLIGCMTDSQVLELWDKLRTMVP